MDQWLNRVRHSRWPSHKDSMMDVLIDGVWFEVLEVDSYFVDPAGRRRAFVAASDGHGVISVDVSLYTSRVHHVTD